LPASGATNVCAEKLEVYAGYVRRP
jgi:hypothetical protein